MTQDQKPQWQQQVAAAIINPAAITPADKLRLLCEWPILRAWAQSMLKRNPDKVPAKTIDAYLRDALAWSGHLGNPADLFTGSEHPAGFVGAVIAARATTVPAASASVPATKPDSTNKVSTPLPRREGQGVGLPGMGLDRPTHFDQYRHLVPEELNDQFDTEITDLYLQRAELGAKRDQLAEAVEQAMYVGEEKVEDEASAALSVVAQQLVNVETTLLHFWALVDVAFKYYQLNGEIMPIEDLRAQAGDTTPSAKRQRAPRTPDYTKAEIDAMPEGEEREAQKAERIRKNAQFLRDKRKAETARANGGEAYDKWREQIILRAREMEEWGEALTAVQQDIVASVTDSE